MRVIRTSKEKIRMFGGSMYVLIDAVNRKLLSNRLGEPLDASKHMASLEVIDGEPPYLTIRLMNKPG